MLGVGLGACSQVEIFEVVVQKHEFLVNADGLAVELPRLMLAVSPVLHEGQQSTDLGPPDEEPLLRRALFFVAANIEAEVEVPARAAVNDVGHGLLEAVDIVVLVAHPSRKHDVLGGVAEEGLALQAVDGSRHDERIGVFGFGVVVESAVVLVCVFVVGHVPLQL